MMNLQEILKATESQVEELKTIIHCDRVLSDNSLNSIHKKAMEVRKKAASEYCNLAKEIEQYWLKNLTDKKR